MYTGAVDKFVYQRKTKTHTHDMKKMHLANINPRPSRCASSSTAPAPPLSVPAPPWPPPRPASQACGTAPRYIALANETHSSVPARSWPSVFQQSVMHHMEGRGRRRRRKKRNRTHIHDVVEHYERRSFCFWLVPDAYLPDASVAAEKVV